MSRCTSCDGEGRVREFPRNAVRLVDCDDCAGTGRTDDEPRRPMRPDVEIVRALASLNRYPLHEWADEGIAEVLDGVQVRFVGQASVCAELDQVVLAFAATSRALLALDPSVRNAVLERLDRCVEHVDQAAERARFRADVHALIGQGVR